jgi:N-acyl-phosphatidylethanolamine-hydrolysing phospholipase D
LEIEKLEIPSGSNSLYAAHYKDGRFFNPWSPFPHSLFDLVKFWVRVKPPEAVRPLTPRRSLPRVDADGSSAITWVGHCTFVVQEGTNLLLTDPHWGPRLRIRERKAPPGLPLTTIPDGAFAVVSHSHYDHLDRYTVSRLPAGTRWFVPLGLARWFRKAGHDNVVELDWWHRVRVDGWTFTCLPAQHWSLRVGQRRHGTLWCSWLIQSPSRTFYFAGDTGYFHGFEEYGRRFAPIDVAFLPIGTYEPRWHLAYQHMDPGEAYQASEDLGARVMIPMHWGTFQMGWDRLDEAPRALYRHIADRDGDPGRVRTLGIGESWSLS